MKSYTNAVEILKKRFGNGPVDVVSRAPGRVNLIGEHTDYNGGYVLPFAVDRFTEVALRRRRDMRVRVYSSAFDEVLSVKLPLDSPGRRGGWPDYILGILRELSDLMALPRGFDAAIAGDVPIGAGLSSSASLEVAVAVGLVRLYGLDIEDLELVKLCQRAERDFVGMPCGIMDQYAAYFGEPGKAIFLDTRALSHRTVTLNLEDVAFLVIDSGVRRSLADSGYARRRGECEEAVSWLARRFPGRRIEFLRDVTPEMLDEVRGEMPENLWKRAAHVVGENQRVLAAVEALEAGDPVEVGALVHASHVSLRDLFQVSTPELDFLVDWGISHGALGARLVGGGFGGVTLHLVPRERKDGYIRGITSAYRRRFGLEAVVMEVRPGPGARELLLSR